MTAPHADQLIDGYLARLRDAATDLPSGVRDELIEDMRAHIAEARTREPQETDATILNILDRLGEPDAVVAEAGRRPDDAFGSGQPSGRAEPYRAGILEIATVVLLPFLWPVAVILLWLSPAWKTRDKVIGTLLPPGGYPGLLFLGVFVAHAGVTAIGYASRAGNSCVTTTDVAGDTHTLCGATPLQVIGVVLSLVLVVVLWLLPAITAGYLAVRLRWGRRPQALATT